MTERPPDRRTPARGERGGLARRKAGLAKPAAPAPAAVAVKPKANLGRPMGPNARHVALDVLDRVLGPTIARSTRPSRATRSWPSSPSGTGPSRASWSPPCCAAWARSITPLCRSCAIGPRS